MSKIQETTIGQLVEFQRGYDLPKSQFVNGKYPVISSNGVLGYHNQYKSKGPGITIGRSGTVGLPQYIKSDFFPHNTSLFIKNFNGNDVKYIYYLLKTFGLNKRKSGSGVPTMNRNHLHPLKVKAYLDVDDQQKIAHILSTLDSKIELNNRINAELEKIAKTLYNYWFVQFDFPDQNGKPYKSSGEKMVFSEKLKREIPEGWEVKRISDLLPVVTGKEDANFATKNGKYNFFTCGEEILKCDEWKFEGKSILIAGNGNFNIKLYEGKFNAYQRTYVLIPNNEEHYTVVYLATKDRIDSFTKGSRGSIVKFITKGDIENIQIPMPKNNFSKNYKALNDITKKIELNLEENQKLTELRDWLLPMLMNGQVEVV